jgi:hypothetical protein
MMTSLIFFCLLCLSSQAVELTNVIFSPFHNSPHTHIQPFSDLSLPQHHMQVDPKRSVTKQGEERKGGQTIYGESLFTFCKKVVGGAIIRGKKKVCTCNRILIF